MGVELWSSYLAEQARGREDAIVGLVTRQIVHNLKSPISSMSHLIEATHEIPPERMKMMREIVGRMSDMVNGIIPAASTLLQKIQGTSFATAPSTELEHGLARPPFNQTGLTHLESLLEVVISAHRIAATSRGNAISFDAAPGRALFANLDALAFKQVISNLIDNAIEASTPDQPIEIELKQAADAELTLSIRDYGRGIPKGHRSQLGQRGFTFGKERGSGLGLYHAISVVRALGGRIEIDCGEKQGTRVDVVIPMSPTPTWFAQSLPVSPPQRCVILDDEPGIAEIWRSKLDGKCGELVYLRSIAEADAFLADAIRPSDVLLFDYELLGETSTGLDLLERAQTHRQRYLVSSYSDDASVIARLERLSIQLIPKSSLLTAVPPANCKA